MLSICQRFASGLCCAVALLLTMSCPVLAVPMVHYTATDAGSGFFQYNLTLFTGPNFTARGLIVVNGFSVFQLDASSDISAPVDVNGCPCNAWSFFAPIPPFADNLAYFSPGVVAGGVDGDIKPNEVQSGFAFRSITAPNTLANETFAVTVIGVIDGQTDLSNSDVNARLVPEPSSVLLLGSVLAGLVVFGRKRLRKNL